MPIYFNIYYPKQQKITGFPQKISRHAKRHAFICTYIHTYINTNLEKASSHQNETQIRLMSEVSGKEFKIMMINIPSVLMKKVDNRQEQKWVKHTCREMETLRKNAKSKMLKIRKHSNRNEKYLQWDHQ